VLERFRTAQKDYPSQFWLLFWGMLISTTGASMIWPFLMIYVSEKLQLPLTNVASLLTVNAVMGLIFSFIAGPIVDRLGRKWVMVISLALNAIAYIFLSRANTLLIFAVLYSITGSVNPLYRVGADAMMADLIPPAKRPDAYSLLRMSSNVGVALGPAIGGFIAAVSYTRAFYIAFIGMFTYSMLLAFLAKETIPRQIRRSVSDPRIIPEPGIDAKREAFGGYAHIAKDRQFLFFVAAFSFTGISAMIMWALLSVYAKENFGLPENLYGWIPTTNAIMVVFLQLWVTEITKKRPALLVSGVGALFYAIGVGSVALGQGFWWFWASMVVMTVGELIIMPTATTYVANLAPVDMRGRYMSIFGLTWGIAAAVGPILGGFLNDNFGPYTIWYGGLVAGLISALGFFLLYRRMPQPSQTI
jgi:MFS family permease